MNGRIIRDITDFIFISDEPETADIIFIPGGSHPQLGEMAAALYALEYAPRVLPSGGVSVKTGAFGGVKARREKYNKSYLTDWDFLSDVLKINGVPQDAILREDMSGHTKENALFSRKVTDAAGLDIRRAIVVCKNFHARRCLTNYALAFPEAQIFVYPVHYFEGDTKITRDNWHTTEPGVRRVLGELARCGNQFVDEFIAHTEGK